jgi:preprotein translocase subunit SecG
MYSVIVILMVVAAVLMCFIVLIQESKGGGLASGFASSNQIMGVRKTTDFIEKATWTLAIALVVFSVASAYFVPSPESQKSVVLKDNAMPALPMQQNTQKSTTLPAAGNAQNNATQNNAAASENATGNAGESNAPAAAPQK